MIYTLVAALLQHVRVRVYVRACVRVAWGWCQAAAMVQACVWADAER